VLENMDWLSRLLELVPVRGRIEHRCFFGAPWQLTYDPSEIGEMPYHIVLAGRAMLDDPAGGPPLRLAAGDILVLPQGSAHNLHDGSGAPPAAARQHHGPTVTIDENDGTGERLDMLCGRFLLSPAHNRLLRAYFPQRLIVSTTGGGGQIRQISARGQLSNLVGLMRTESANENLGGYAMLNGLSAALFTLTMRLSSEAAEVPRGLVALAGFLRLAPALSALFHRPDKDWTLPALAALCNMSRATFVRQFQHRLGRSAAELLMDIRMTVAAQALRISNASTGAVAEDVGYQSEAAFQRVFKKQLGITPAEFRRQMRLSSKTTV
jgi:AraC family transcriptional activator of mtrCDE